MDLILTIYLFAGMYIYAIYGPITAVPTTEQLFGKKRICANRYLKI